MAKYEKFEEWMLDASVVTSNGEKGVVEAHLGDDVYVAFTNGTSCWHTVSNLEFLEEAPSKEEKAIPWEVGQVVWDVVEGKGVVTRVGCDIALFPVKVEFDDGDYDYYTAEGKSEETDKIRRLYFSEPKIIAETMPPKKPFVPKLKEGDKVLIKDKQGLFGEGTVRVVHKECDDRVYISKDGNYFMKHDIASLQVLGEEIKWD